jgi:serine/threonine protein phosphatase PrpC
MEKQTPQPWAQEGLPGLETTMIPAKLNFYASGSAADARDTSFVVGACSVPGRHPPFPWTNQDEQVIIKLSDHLILAAVFDGHGQTGHLISAFVKQVFEQYAADLVLDQGLEPHDALLCLFRVAHEGLRGERDLAWLSGSTAAAVLIDSKTGFMTAAHSGDSRILVIDDDSGIVFETRDHTIRIFDEARIVAAGGEVREATHCGITSKRIFVKGENHPGLAMARSLGDLEAQSVGALSDPDLQQNIPIGRNSTVVIATDGIWEKMTSAEVRDALQESGQDLQQSVVSLVDLASSKWAIQKDVDDITAVLIRTLEVGDTVLDRDISDTGGTGQAVNEISHVGDVLAANESNRVSTGAYGEISVLDIPSAAPMDVTLGNYGSGCLKGIDRGGKGGEI